MLLSGVTKYIVAHWRDVATRNWENIDSGKSLLPDGIKSFHKIYPSHQLQKLFRNYIFCV